MPGALRTFLTALRGILARFPLRVVRTSTLDDLYGLLVEQHHAVHEGTQLNSELMEAFTACAAGLVIATKDRRIKNPDLAVLIEEALTLLRVQDLHGKPAGIIAEAGAKILANRATVTG